VHTYRAAETGLFVNSYLIEGDEGVLVVDTNLLVSDIEALRARVGALKKPLVGVMVTHAHPDHFNGVLGLVKDREVPVYAAPSVARVIHEIAEAKRAQWSPTYGEEWPAETYYPNTLVPDGEAIAFEGMTASLHEVGPAESHADSYLLVGPPGGHPVAFIGDLAFNGTHPYTADGHSGAWLAALDVLTDRLAEATALYPGHGDPAGPQVLADQRRYLLYYREIVRRLADGEPALSAAAKQELDRCLQVYLPGAPLTWMVGLGADAVAAELASEATLAVR
jgi:glyoxylase-like metal-dependent hydrolase (beta-lactamase superfamily II)